MTAKSVFVVGALLVAGAACGDEPKDEDESLLAEMESWPTCSAELVDNPLRPEGTATFTVELPCRQADPADSMYTFCMDLALEAGVPRVYVDAADSSATPNRGELIIDCYNPAARR